LSATLVDTQALLWLMDGNPKLSAVALARMTEPTSDLFFSYASAWEIAIKYGKGKLTLPEPPQTFLLKQLSLNKVRLLPISMGSIFVAGALPQGAHKDPFDRLIAAQCLRHDLTLVSIDTAFDAYGVRRIW
jgi:PIN domain nuclease of toxin-antitoxin system